MTTFPRRWVEELGGGHAERLLESARADEPPARVVAAAILTATKSERASQPEASGVRASLIRGPRKIVFGAGTFLVGGMLAWSFSDELSASRVAPWASPSPPAVADDRPRLRSVGKERRSTVRDVGRRFAERAGDSAAGDRRGGSSRTEPGGGRAEVERTDGRSPSRGEPSARARALGGGGDDVSDGDRFGGLDRPRRIPPTSRLATSSCSKVARRRRYRTTTMPSARIRKVRSRRRHAGEGRARSVPWDGSPTNAPRSTSSVCAIPTARSHSLQRSASLKSGH